MRTLQAGNKWFILGNRSSCLELLASICRHRLESRLVGVELVEILTDADALSLACDRIANTRQVVTRRRTRKYKAVDKAHILPAKTLTRASSVDGNRLCPDYTIWHSEKTASKCFNRARPARQIYDQRPVLCNVYWLLLRSLSRRTGQQLCPLASSSAKLFLLGQKSR